MIQKDSDVQLWTFLEKLKATGDGVKAVLLVRLLPPAPWLFISLGTTGIGNSRPLDQYDAMLFPLCNGRTWWKSFPVGGSLATQTDSPVACWCAVISWNKSSLRDYFVSWMVCLLSQSTWMFMDPFMRSAFIDAKFLSEQLVPKVAPHPNRLTSVKIWCTLKILYFFPCRGLGILVHQTRLFFTFRGTWMQRSSFSYIMLKGSQ